MKQVETAGKHSVPEIAVADHFKALAIAKKDKTQFSRRNSVRAAFAAIEADLNFHWSVLEELLNRPTTPPETLAILRHHQYILEDDGTVRANARTPSLIGRMYFLLKTFPVLAKAAKANLQYSVKPEDKGRLKEAWKVRLRVTHPSITESFDVTDEEMFLIEASVKWWLEHTRGALCQTLSVLIDKMHDHTNASEKDRAYMQDLIRKVGGDWWKVFSDSK